MSYYHLCNYDERQWEQKKSILEAFTANKLQDLIELLSNFTHIETCELNRSLIYLKNFNDEPILVNLINQIVQYALKLSDLIPSGKIERMTRSNPKLEFNRKQILCILCHMFLCTLKKDKNTVYWVNFDIWFNMSTKCSISYLESLIEYFRESFNLISTDYMNEIVKFEKKKFDHNLLNLLNEKIQLCDFEIKLNGSIGDYGQVEIDFANMDIGYGKTGTQEEILFAASPEMCIAILFADTLADDEATIITGARKISKFNGYGLNVEFKEKVQDNRDWSKRKVIAIDAMDFSSYANESFKAQTNINNMQRELEKCLVGFSEVNNSIIETGHWGCGCFNGNKYLKAIIQWIAASCTKNKIVFYCFSSGEFEHFFPKFVQTLKDKNVSVDQLWNQLSQKNIDETNFLHIIEQNLN